MVVDERASLVLLIIQKPIGDFKHDVREICFPRDLPPLAEGLQQPRDLPEVALIPEPMSIVLKTSAKSFVINFRCVLFARYGEGEENLTGKVILECVGMGIIRAKVSCNASVRQFDASP